MFTISKEANINYLAKVVVVNKIQIHPNADRLRVTEIDFQSVIIGDNITKGSVMVHFPVEAQLNAEFLSWSNSYRDKTLNMDSEKAGFFEKNGRVRAVKLRGVASMGYLVPMDDILGFLTYKGVSKSFETTEEEYFDTICGVLMVQKYVVKRRDPQPAREGKKPRISRLVEKQVRLHVDTENLRKSVHEINPDDEITISYKTHGTSWWVSNVLVFKKLDWFYKLLKKIGIKIQDTEYDFVYGSRKVVKNEYETSHKEHFYKTDIWGEIKDEIMDRIPKGFTLYGEALGYTSYGAEIQKGYDYGCNPGERKLQVYRITFTNVDGVVNEFSSPQIKEFCERFGLDYVHVLYSGLAKDLYPELSTKEHWHRNFVENLKRDFNEKDCFMCKNSVPEEGIVLRKESLFEFRAYKLKSERFYQYETEMLDAEVEDIESQN